MNDKATPRTSLSSSSITREDWAGFRDGCPKATSRIYRAYIKKLEGVARQLGHWDPEDAAQETFAEALRRRAGYDPDRACAAFLFQRHRWRVRTDVRRAARQAPVGRPVGEDSVEEVLDRMRDTTKLHAEQERARDYADVQDLVQDLLEQLGDKKRTLLEDWVQSILQGRPGSIRDLVMDDRTFYQVRRLLPETKQALFDEALPHHRTLAIRCVAQALEGLDPVTHAVALAWAKSVIMARPASVAALAQQFGLAPEVVLESIKRASGCLEEQVVKHLFSVWVPSVMPVVARALDTMDLAHRTVAKDWMRSKLMGKELNARALQDRYGLGRAVIDGIVEEARPVLARQLEMILEAAKDDSRPHVESDSVRSA